MRDVEETYSNIPWKDGAYINVTKKEHKFFREVGVRKDQVFGRYHYTFESKRGEISLIELTHPLYSDAPWEIYCREGGLFQDVKRYAEFSEATDAVKEYLDYKSLFERLRRRIT